MKYSKNIVFRAVATCVMVTLLTTTIIPRSYAQVNLTQTPGVCTSCSVLNLPVPGTFVLQSDDFMPVLVKGLTIHPENPLLFDFIVNTGDTGLEGENLKVEANKLIKYFMAALTIPEDQMWVNLSPDEPDRIIPEGLGDTAMGRDMLAQDYLLKQLTASMMYPEEELGEAFWGRIYERAYAEYGRIDIPTDMFHKIWIVPEKATVYEHEKSASVYVINNHLKVMLEEDYLVVDRRGLIHQTQDKGMINHAPTDIIREIILPEIEREVNEGATFANLRQIFHSMILAAWYKQNLKKSLLGHVYVDQNKTKGVDTQDKEITQKIYNQYLEAFRTGVYDLMKEDYDLATQQIIPRKYFSGGIQSDFLMKGKMDIIYSEGISDHAMMKEWFRNKTGKDFSMRTLAIESDTTEMTQTALVLADQSMFRDLREDDVEGNDTSIFLNEYRKVAEGIVEKMLEAFGNTLKDFEKESIDEEWNTTDKQILQSIIKMLQDTHKKLKLPENQVNVLSLVFDDIIPFLEGVIKILSDRKSTKFEFLISSLSLFVEMFNDIPKYIEGRKRGEVVIGKESVIHDLVTNGESPQTMLDELVAYSNKEAKVKAEGKIKSFMDKKRRVIDPLKEHTEIITRIDKVLLDIKVISFLGEETTSFLGATEEALEDLLKKLIATDEFKGMNPINAFDYDLMESGLLFLIKNSGGELKAFDEKPEKVEDDEEMYVLVVDELRMKLVNLNKNLYSLGVRLAPEIEVGVIDSIESFGMEKFKAEFENVIHQNFSVYFSDNKDLDELLKNGLKNEWKIESDELQNREILFLLDVPISERTRGDGNKNWNMSDYKEDIIHILPAAIADKIAERLNVENNAVSAKKIQIFFQKIADDILEGDGDDDVFNIYEQAKQRENFVLEDEASKLEKAANQVAMEVSANFKKVAFNDKEFRKISFAVEAMTIVARILKERDKAMMEQETVQKRSIIQWGKVALIETLRYLPYVPLFMGAENVPIESITKVIDMGVDFTKVEISDVQQVEDITKVMEELKRKSDEAMVINTDGYGGINFDSSMMDLKIKRDGHGVPLSIEMQDLDTAMQVPGFEPHILFMAPVNMMEFLGMTDSLPGDVDDTELLSQEARWWGRMEKEFQI